MTGVQTCALPICRLIKLFIYPTAAIQLIIAICIPAAIEGPEQATIVGAISKTIIYALTGFIIYFATKRGEDMYFESVQMLEKINENKSEAEKITQELNSSINRITEEVSLISNQSTGVLTSTEQMKVAVENLSSAVITVNDKVLQATDSAETNYELAKELGKSFVEVGNAVQMGNEGANDAKQSLDQIGGSVELAKDATTDLLTEMSHISNILDEINAIANQTNLL